MIHNELIWCTVYYRKILAGGNSGGRALLIADLNPNCPAICWQSLTVFPLYFNCCLCCQLSLELQWHKKRRLASHLKTLLRATKPQRHLTRNVIDLNHSLNSSIKLSIVPAEDGVLTRRGSAGNCWNDFNRGVLVSPHASRPLGGDWRSFVMFVAC